MTFDLIGVARSHHNARRASRPWRMQQVNTPRIRRAFVENFSDAPLAQDNLSKLLTALSAIVAPSAGTFQNLGTFLVRVPALFASMVESAVKKKNQKLCVTMLVDIHLYVYCNS